MSTPFRPIHRVALARHPSEPSHSRAVNELREEGALGPHKLNDKPQDSQLWDLILFHTQNAGTWCGRGQQHREHIIILGPLHNGVFDDAFNLLLMGIVICAEVDVAINDGVGYWVVVNQRPDGSRILQPKAARKAGGTSL
jgi:hypothetical protein